jgi:hypothetical protein
MRVEAFPSGQLLFAWRSITRIGLLAESLEEPTHNLRGKGRRDLDKAALGMRSEQSSIRSSDFLRPGCDLAGMRPADW